MTAGGRLILVRHGETVGNSSIRYFGRTDVPLSDLGRAQMLAVAKWLKLNLQGDRFDAVFASPLCRATEGARLIVGASASVVEIEEFVEVDFGLFEGLTAEEIRERHPIEFEQWNRDRLDPNFTYPRGESRAAFMERVGCGIQRVLELCDGAASTVLIVAHRGVIRAITQRLAEVAPIIELGSIQMLRRDENPHGHAAKWRVEITDMIDHLKGVG
jgi:broad specificity phosphatase PhoE